MRAQMTHFKAKIEVFGTFGHQKLIYLLLYVFILILLLKSFHLVLNLPFKNVALPLFDPKIGPKKLAPNHKEVSFWPFEPLYSCNFILKVLYSDFAHGFIAIFR